MNYWLMKSEPGTWSFDQQQAKNTTSWDGVRNYQACNAMKAMKMGDLCFFYHSNVGKEIVGIVKVVRTYYPDHTDTSGRFGMVDVAFHSRLPRPIPLQAIKQNPALADLYLVRQPRLSVMPVSSQQWDIIIAMSQHAKE